jgi:DNA processing protein
VEASDTPRGGSCPVGTGGMPSPLGTGGTEGPVGTDAEAEATRRARVWLSRAVEPGMQVVHAFVAEHGPVEAVRRIRSGAAPPGVLDRVGARAAEDNVDADLAEAERCGIRFVTPEDDEWPTVPLLALELAGARGVPDIAPPQALWVRGRARLCDVVERAVAVVGARAASGYGEHVAGELGYCLARLGWTVVSGGAYGIDGAAHRGALAAGGPTVAVIAGGLDAPYPAGHAALFDRIAENGLLVSEWPAGCTPQRHRFLIRNRLVAGLAAGTVVVEAGARSGTRSTARRTTQLGRPVMAVPGPVTSSLSTGPHLLIRDHGARLVSTAAEVVEEVGSVGDDLAPRPEVPSTPADRLDPLAARVLDAVPVGTAAPPERIAVEAGVGLSDVLRCLPALELLDLVEAVGPGWRVCRQVPPPHRSPPPT